MAMWLTWRWSRGWREPRCNPPAEPAWRERTWAWHQRLEQREAARPPEPRSNGRFETQVEDRDVLWTALAGLPPRRRVVVVLRIVEDLSEEQTAAMLGIPTGTVKSRLARGLAALRATLDGGDG